LKCPHLGVVDTLLSFALAVALAACATRSRGREPADAAVRFLEPASEAGGAQSPWPMNCVLQIEPRLEPRPAPIPVRVGPGTDARGVEWVDRFSCPWGTFYGSECGVERNDATDGSIEFELWGSSGWVGGSIVLRFRRGSDGSLIGEMIDQHSGTHRIPPFPADSTRVCKSATGEIVLASADLSSARRVRCGFDVTGSWHRESREQPTFDQDWELHFSGEVDLPAPR